MTNNKQSDSQRQIVRQSQSKLTLDWANSCGYCLDLKELVGITEVMTDYVQYGYSKELGDRLDKIQEHLNNK